MHRSPASNNSEVSNSKCIYVFVILSLSLFIYVYLLIYAYLLHCTYNWAARPCYTNLSTPHGWIYPIVCIVCLYVMLAIIAPKYDVFYHNMSTQNTEARSEANISGMNEGLAILSK